MISKKEIMKNWIKNNPDKWKEIQKKSQKKYKQKHREKVNALARKWRKNNLEKSKKHRENWNLKNKEYFKIYKLKNPEKVKESRRKYRLKNGSGRLKLRFKILKKDNFTCQYCGRKAPDVILQIDHIHPRSKGGLDIIENYKTACFECNIGKGDCLIEFNS